MIKLTELIDSVGVVERIIVTIEAERDDLTVDPDDYKEGYKDYLDEDGPLYVDGVSFEPSMVMEEMDSVAFEQGLLAFVDDIRVKDTLEYQRLAEELEEREEELDELMDKIRELEDEIKELE